MLQLHPELNLLGAWPIHKILQLLERPTPVHVLCVLAPVQEPRRLPDANDGGGTVWELPRGGTLPARKPLASPGAVSGARNQGGGAQKREEEGVYNTVEHGGSRKYEGEEELGEDTDGSSLNGSSASVTSTT